MGISSNLLDKRSPRIGAIIFGFLIGFAAFMIPDPNAPITNAPWSHNWIHVYCNHALLWVHADQAEEGYHPGPANTFHISSLRDITQRDSVHVSSDCRVSSSRCPWAYFYPWTYAATWWTCKAGFLGWEHRFLTVIVFLCRSLTIPLQIAWLSTGILTYFIPEAVVSQNIDIFHKPLVSNQ